MSGQTWGDIISRNYSAGRAIGDDFSNMRFQKRAEEVKNTFAERAKTEGKNLEDYLPELEEELAALATDVGATRRGVTGRDGQTLDRGYAGALYKDVERSGERRASAAALGGDQAGARDSRARTQGALGNFDASQQQQIAGDTIRATQGAMKPDGTYDMAGGAQALAGVGARYGDASAAATQQGQATSFRLQNAVAKTGTLFEMFNNLEAYSGDQIAGIWEGIKENAPEAKDIDLRKSDDGTLVVYTGGKATGSFDPKDQADVDELSQMLTSFSNEPGAALSTYMQARLKAIQDQKTTTAEFSGKIDDAMIKAVGDMTAAGVPSGLASKIGAAATGTGQSNGWQLQDTGEEPGSYLMQKGGQVYTIKTNVAPNPETGEVGGALQVFKADGTPVDASVLNAADKAGFDYTISAVTDMMKISNAGQAELVKTKLQALGAIRESRLGGGGGSPSPGASTGSPVSRSSGGNSRAERNNNPGNIEDRGQFEGVEGYLGSDGRFAKFATIEAGQKAMQHQLGRYMDGKTTGSPLTTVSQIVGTWSPQSDPTNQAGSTSNYANYVAKKLGVDPGAQLSREQLPALASAMAEFESGNTSGAPAGRERGALFAGVKSSATSAGSAPEARSPITRAGQVNGQAAPDAETAQAELAQAQKAITQFREDFGVGRYAMRNKLTGSQFTVMKQLEAELDTAKVRAQAAVDQQRELSGALARVNTEKKDARDASELYTRYGGAADFFLQAP